MTEKTKEKIKIELTREEANALVVALSICEELKNSISDKLLVELLPGRYTEEQKEKIRGNA